MVYHVTMSNGRPITLLPNVFRRNLGDGPSASGNRRSRVRNGAQAARGVGSVRGRVCITSRRALASRRLALVFHHAHRARTRPPASLSCPDTSGFAAWPTSRGAYPTTMTGSLTQKSLSITLSVPFYLCWEFVRRFRAQALEKWPTSRPP
jgi:hypothetical protein